AMFQSVGGCEAVPSMVNMVLGMSLLTSWAISRVPCGCCPSARSAWGQSGKHMLAVRFTRFDPKRKSCLGLPTDNLHSVLHSTSPKWAAPRGLDAKLCRRIGFLRHLLKENSRAGKMIISNRDSGGRNGRG